MFKPPQNKQINTSNKQVEEVEEDAAPEAKKDSVERNNSGKALSPNDKRTRGK